MGQATFKKLLTLELSGPLGLACLNDRHWRRKFPPPAPKRGKTPWQGAAFPTSPYIGRRRRDIHFTSFVCRRLCAPVRHKLGCRRCRACSQITSCPTVVQYCTRELKTVHTGTYNNPSEQGFLPKKLHSSWVPTMSILFRRWYWTEPILQTKHYGIWL